MNGFDAKKFGIVVLIIIIISIAGFVISSSFVNKKTEPTEPEPTESIPKEIKNLPVTSVYPVELDENEKIINMQVSDIMVQSLDGKVYLNGKELVGLKADNAYVTQEYILFTYKGECGDYISYAIDKKANEIKFTKPDYQLTDFRIDVDKCYATVLKDCSCTSDTCENQAISFETDGKILLIK